MQTFPYLILVRVVGALPVMETFEEVFTKDHFIEVLEALHYDQTGLAEALVDVRRLANSWAWAAESRGSYEWDDDRYQQEFGACLDTIIGRIDAALNKTSRAHQVCCGTYRNIGFHEKSSVQLRLDFGNEDYADFVERMIKLATIEGHGLSQD